MLSERERLKHVQQKARLRTLGCDAESVRCVSIFSSVRCELPCWAFALCAGALRVCAAREDGAHAAVRGRLLWCVAARDLCQAAAAALSADAAPAWQRQVAQAPAILL
jgi:hypothetical protein